MRTKLPQLRQAQTGHFDEHHAILCATMLHRIDALAADVATLNERIDAMIAAYAGTVVKLDEIPGIGQRSAQELIAEIGLTMTCLRTIMPRCALVCRESCVHRYPARQDVRQGTASLGVDASHSVLPSPFRYRPTPCSGISLALHAGLCI